MNEEVARIALVALLNYAVHDPLAGGIFDEAIEYLQQQIDAPMSAATAQRLFTERLNAVGQAAVDADIWCAE